MCVYLAWGRCATARSAHCGSSPPRRVGSTTAETQARPPPLLGGGGAATRSPRASAHKRGSRVSHGFGYRGGRGGWVRVPWGRGGLPRLPSAPGDPLALLEQRGAAVALCSRADAAELALDHALVRVPARGLQSRAISCDRGRSRAISCDLVRSRAISCDRGPIWVDLARSGSISRLIPAQLVEGRVQLGAGAGTGESRGQLAYSRKRKAVLACSRQQVDLGESRGISGDLG